MQRREREVYQVNSEVQHASSAGQLEVVKPRLVRPIRIVKPGIDCEYFSERATLDQPAHRLHCRNAAVTKIEAEQAARVLRRFNDVSRFERVSSEWFLTEDSHAAS